MASETSEEQNVRLGKLQQAYLAGDNMAGDTILQEYEGLIKSTILKYYGRHDIFMGFSVEDAFQIARLKILQSLKHFDFDKCKFTYFVADSSVWACGRLWRWCSSIKRNYKNQCDYDLTLYAHIPDNSVKQPDQIALENEFWNIIEQRISTMPADCQAVYQVAIEEREGVYNSNHPLLKKLGHGSMQIRIEKVRKAVREVLESY